MRKFNFEDYRKALKGAGPITKKNILERAINDRNISSSDFEKLCKFAYET